MDAALYEIGLPSVAAALARARLRGVRVRLHLESDNAWEPRERACLRLLRGFDVSWDDRPAAMHHKCMIRDGSAVWTGSANLTWTGAHLHWNEAVIVEDATIARAYAQRFEELHSGVPGPATASTATLRAAFHPEARRAALLAFVRDARATLDVAAFSLTDPALVDALIAARDRGVDVRIALDARQSHGPAGARAVDRLRAAGLVPRIPDARPHPDLLRRFGISPGQDLKLHHKLMRADGARVLTGSANFSAGGMDRNDEDVLVIDDPATAQAYGSVLEKVHATTR